MGKVFSTAARYTAQRFNVESRAHKVIAKDKPIKAPMHEANLKDLERILKDHPEIVEQSSKKSSDLDDRLKKVFVKSSDYLEQRRIIDPARPLPTNKQFTGYFEYGFKETEIKKIPEGKASLRQVIEFISLHQTKPTEWTAEKIAEDYKINLETVNNILENFKMFEVYIPEVKTKTSKFLISDPFDRKSANFSQMVEIMEPKPKEKEKLEKKRNASMDT